MPAKIAIYRVDFRKLTSENTRQAGGGALAATMVGQFWTGSMDNRHFNISQEFLAACRILEIDPTQVLVRMGLPAHALENRGLLLSARQVALSFEQIINEYGRDDFHIRLADGFARGAFGHAFLALQCSDNLRDGIHRVARFKQLIEPVDWIISEADDLFEVELRSLTPDFPLVGIGQIMSFLWLVKSCRNVSAKPISPTRVIITDPVPHQTEIEADLSCPVEVGDRARLIFSAGAMDAAVLSCNHRVIQQLDAAGARTLHPSPREDDFIATVRSIVLDMLPSGVVTLERTADKLALSKRTLERRLRERDSHFIGILRDCRVEMARHYLRDTEIPIAEISLLLGYREVNSFYRACKEWFDCTPQEARAGRRFSNA